MSVAILEQVQADTRTAMKAGERDRVGTLRMLADALQQDEKEGERDEVTVLQRERKKRPRGSRCLRERRRDERQQPSSARRA